MLAFVVKPRKLKKENNLIDTIEVTNCGKVFCCEADDRILT